MEIENISTITCNNRNNYDKNFCTNLNPDKIVNFLKPYNNDPLGIINNNSFFNKNSFDLYDETKKIEGLAKEKCAIYSIDNNYKGFTYNGDKNKCISYKSNIFDKNNKKYNDNYKMKTFLKTKNTIDPPKDPL